MGTLKIEIDLPEFKDQLELNITIKRDGEVIYYTSPSTPGGGTGTSPNLGEEKKVEKKETTKEVKSEKAPSKKLGGNMMNLDI